MFGNSAFVTYEMADEADNDEQWLYGENPDVPGLESAAAVEHDKEAPPETNKTATDPADNSDIAPPGTEDDAPPGTEGEGSAATTTAAAEGEEQEPGELNEEEEDQQNGEGSDKEDFGEDSDDDVNIVIGDIKTGSTYSSLNIKRGGLLTTSSKTDKGPQPPQAGKFAVEDFEQPGSINGVPVGDFNLDALEDKPWRKPGADITDYFNYGFNEDTWRAYCERQKRMRVSESGSGLLPLNSMSMPRVGTAPIMNDNSKYAGGYPGAMLKKAGPPPGRKMAGAIDVIGANLRLAAAAGKSEPPKENAIQVMTADRREYSRKPGFPDMTVPPPAPNFEDFQPEFGFNPEPEPFYGGYEPTQDMQWGPDAPNANPPWQPQEIKSLGPSPAPMMAMPPPGMAPPSTVSVPQVSPKEGSPVVKSRERDRESSRRERSRDKERAKSHRRDRSRSKSHRHRSRSRSPSHRSHKKKKSRRHEDSD